MSVGVVDKNTGDPIPTAGMPYKPNYSTTEQKTGQKWIDGKDIYFKTIELDAAITINANSWTAEYDLIADRIISVNALYSGDNNVFPVGGSIANNKISVLNVRNSIITVDTFIVYFTKTT